MNKDIANAYAGAVASVAVASVLIVALFVMGDCQKNSDRSDAIKTCYERGLTDCPAVR